LPEYTLKELSAEERRTFFERLSVVWDSKEYWISVIYYSLETKDRDVANIIFEMMADRADPDDTVIRSLRELAIYYTRPGLMPERTLEQVRLMFASVEKSLKVSDLGEVDR
jgi:hypothetical protein